MTNFEAVARPAPGRPAHQSWPCYPTRLRSSPSHEEGCERHWGVLTQTFAGTRGQVTRLTSVDIRMISQPAGPPKIEALPGTTRQWPADLVLIAIGYSGPETGTVATSA